MNVTRWQVLLTLSSLSVASLSVFFSQPTSALFDDLLGPNYKTYENSTYNVKVDYPKDWEYQNSEIDKETQPETIFSVIFFSPFESGNTNVGASVSIDIDKVKASTTLDEYKNRIMKNLNEATKDVKEISLSSTLLDGEQAYRIEHAIWLLDHWEKSISIYSVKNGNVYQISALAKPEEIQKYSEAIESMFKSVKFH
jgi:eukaryotic-like serine/threonine-protein kinase